MQRKEIMVKITSFSLATVMLVVTSGCTINKGKSNTISSTVVSTTVEDMNNVNNANSTVELEETPYTYDEIILQLESSYNKFDKNTQNILKKLVDIIYNNADEVDSLFSKISNFEKTSFIIDNIIEPVSKIDFIEIIDCYDYSRLNEIGNSHYDEDKNGIYICNEEEQINYQVLLEELIHTNQTDLVNTDNDLDIVDYYILGEGEANILSWGLCHDNICNDSLSMMYNEDYTEEFAIFGTGYSYSSATKYYMNLVMLVGNDVLEKAKKEQDVTIITKELTNRYSVDGEKLYTDMKKVVIDLIDGIDNKRTDMLIPIENTYYECLEKKLSNLNTKEDILNFFDMYRYTNIQYGLECYEYDEDDNYIDYTNKKINKTNLEKMLFEKLDGFFVFDRLSTDENTKYKIFDSLVNPVKEYEQNIYPISLNNVSISYDDTNNIIITNKETSIITNINSKETKKLDTIEYIGINLFETSEEKII